MTHILKHLFGISPAEATFVRRGFELHDARARCRLEQIGTTFLHGYHAALEAATPDTLATQLAMVEPDTRGFAFEGAAMGLALLDRILPWRCNLKHFLTGCAQSHIYMAYVGIGWAMARLPVGTARTFARLDPLLRWLAIDGYGFHAGYFGWQRAIVQQQRPARLTGYATHTFDQGLGRSLWFVKCAHVPAIAATVDAFAPARRADLWSGIGLACAYAGGVEDHVILTLRDYAGCFLPQVAQGVAFAAKARQHAGNLAAHTSAACTILCDAEAEHAARITDEALVGLPIDVSPSSSPPAYEIWRRRIQGHFAL